MISLNTRFGQTSLIHSLLVLKHTVSDTGEYAGKMNTQRDQELVKTYESGGDIEAFCRENSIGERRFFQILKDNDVERREAVKKADKKPLSKVHERLGRRLNEFYTDNGFERRSAAKRLGWSSQILREVEKGTHDLTLFELQDMAAFIRVEIGAMINGS